MLVSVIINNHNYSRFLKTCIESVLSQTYPHIELIIVDDGSTDDSRQILEGYKHRAKVVLREQGGETPARNEGFSHATGDLVAFLDADDYWKPDAVNTVVKCWKAGTSKLQFHLRVIDDAGNEAGALMPRGRLNEGRVDDLLLTTGRYITCPTSGNFYSREFLAKIFPVPAQDWPQSVDSYAATYAGFYGEIQAIQEPLGFYRVHDVNMTRVAKKTVDLNQIDKLITKAHRLRKLIFKIADELGLRASSKIVTHHWLYLKLELAQLKLGPQNSSRQLLRSAGRMVISCSTAPDLQPLKRLELLIWTVLAVILPKRLADHVIKVGFDLAPTNKWIAALRRL